MMSMMTTTSTTTTCPHSLAKSLFFYFFFLHLLSNSENREHLKNFRNVDCVLANHNKAQDTQANLTTTN